MEERGESNHTRKNVSYAVALLLCWVAARTFHVQVMRGEASGFRSFDLLFIIVPPLGAFFLNWYWMREQRTDTLIQRAVMWAGIDLVVFILAVALLGEPLHQVIVKLSQ